LQVAAKKAKKGVEIQMISADRLGSHTLKALWIILCGNPQTFAEVVEGIYPSVQGQANIRATNEYQNLRARLTNRAVRRRLVAFYEKYGEYARQRYSSEEQKFIEDILQRYRDSHTATERLRSFFDTSRRSTYPRKRKRN
jgi:hypothetical protein